MQRFQDALRRGHRLKIGTYPVKFTTTDNGETTELAAAVDEAFTPEPETDR